RAWDESSTRRCLRWICRTRARTVSKEPRRTDLRVRVLNRASTMVQPRGPLWREVELHVRVSHQPTLDRSRRVGRGVVGNDVEWPPAVAARHEGPLAPGRHLGLVPARNVR